jgi:hypothetical protein
MNLMGFGAKRRGVSLVYPDFRAQPIGFPVIGNQFGKTGYMVEVSMGQQYIPGVEREPFQPRGNDPGICPGIEQGAEFALVRFPGFLRGGAGVLD